MSAQYYSVDGGILLWRHPAYGSGGNGVPPGTAKRLYRNWKVFSQSQVVVWQSTGDSSAPPPPPIGTAKRLFQNWRIYSDGRAIVWQNCGAVTPIPPSPPAATRTGGDDVPRRNPNRGWDKEEWKRLRKDPLDAIENTLRQAYAELKEGPSATKARAIVKPRSNQEINWSALAAKYERANALYKLWQEEQDLQAAMDDDETIMLLLQ